MSNRFINLFVQDYPRKLLALLFAVILYKGVSDNIFVEREITGVPVDVKLSSDLIFQTGQKNLVTIKIKCSERTLKELNPEDFAASVYVGPEHRQNDDIYLVRLRPEMFKQKNGVKIMKTEKIDLYGYFGINRPSGASGYLNAYIIERSEEFSKNRIRPAMLVIAGGGYGMV
jgi:hypothetical protein